eukprot:167128-Chlamydomonas_euryale.AAC.17
MVDKHVEKRRCYNAPLPRTRLLNTERACHTHPSTPTPHPHPHPPIHTHTHPPIHTHTTHERTSVLPHLAASTPELQRRQHLDAEVASQRGAVAGRLVAGADGVACKRGSADGARGALEGLLDAVPARHTLLVDSLRSRGGRRGVKGFPEPGRTARGKGVL